MLNEEKAAKIYGHGWAYYLSDRRPPELLPGLHQGPELVEWIKGYAAALANCDLIGDCPSIESSLRTDGIGGEILERLLTAAEILVSADSGEWMRWPSIPVRYTAEALEERDKRILRAKGFDDEMV